MGEMIFVFLIYFIQFGPALGVSEPIRENGNGEEPRLLCANIYCTKEYEPLCGSDGVTYSNLCEFNRTRGCSNLKNLTIAHKGKCKEAPTPQPTSTPGTLTDCHLPSDTGVCRAAFKKWYFDIRSKTCKQFVYGGCGGNKNRFDSEQECKRSCEPARANKCAFVFCSNWRGRYTQCRIPSSRKLYSVHLLLQRSRQSCLYPSLKFGVRQNSIWVWSGCKGIFIYCYTTGEPKYFDQMQCSSRNLQQERCKIPPGRKLLEATLTTQLSTISCTRPRRKFGITADNQLLVTQGCSGVFKYGYVPDGTSCTSIRSKTNTKGLLGTYVPQCKADGSYEDRQCHGSTGHCWCVNPHTGKMYDGSRKSPDQGPANCDLSLNISNTIWEWYHDGEKKNGEVEFTADKKVIWNSGSPQGSWSVEGNTIKAVFNNVHHELKGNVFTKQAVLTTPYRRPASKMVQIVRKSCAQALAEVDKRIADLPVPKCNADGTYQSQQCNAMIRQCWCVERESGKVIPGTKRDYKEGYVNCSIWKLLQRNVCFGAKKTSFGTIKIKESGRYNTIMLVHNYGYVACHGKGHSNWGCGGKEISVALTDDHNRVRFPSFVDKRGWFISGDYNSKSEVLQLENLKSPSTFEEEDTMRIWYGEDLRGYTEHDNHGEVCVKVYAGFKGFPTPCHDKLAVIRVGVGMYLPQCKPDGRYEEKQCHGSTGHCWCVDPDTGKTIDGTKKGPGEGVVDCKPMWKLQDTVCFGARDTKYGKFTMKNAGTLKKIKLVHSSGYVACHAHGRSNWGCGTAHISVIITNDKNSILFPNNADQRGWYLLPKYTSKSETLELEKPTRPITVKVGDALKVWYGEDLTDYTENDNNGEACAKVYAIVEEAKPPCNETVCALGYDPVCGSNGKTYSSMCEFNNAKRCQEGLKDLKVVNKGPCKSCPEIMCVSQYDPVCGSNGVTYSNECQLKVAQGCRPIKNFTLLHRGECKDKEIIVTIPPSIRNANPNETEPAHQMITVSGTIRYPKQTGHGHLPSLSCVTILFVDDSLMDMPYRLLNSSRLNVGGANLKNGIKYSISAKRPRGAISLSISATINVGWCAKTSNESMQEGDFLTIGSKKLMVPNEGSNVSLEHDLEVDCYGKCYADRITVSGQITYLGRASILPQHSCAIIKILDNLLQDAPSVTIETKVINLTSSHLIDGINYNISARKPEHDYHMYSLSVVVNVGWCAAHMNSSSEEWLRSGDYIDDKPRDMRLQSGNSHFVHNIDLKCYNCKECGKGFYKNWNGTCVQVEKLFKAVIKMNDEYSSALDNSSSAEYRRLAIMVENRLLLATKQSLSDVVDVRVTGFRAGSIIANYDVIMNSEAASVEVTSKDISMVISEAVKSGKLVDLKPDLNFPIDVKEIIISSGKLSTGAEEMCSNFTCPRNKTLCSTGSPNQLLTKVILTQEFSNNVCNNPVKKYGIHRNRLWVKNGCFASFKYCYKQRNVTEGMLKKRPGILKPRYCKVVYCSSDLNSHYSICKTGENHTLLNVTLVRRGSRTSCISPIPKYGINSNKLWVSGGCVGDFRYCYDVGSAEMYADTKCKSIDGKGGSCNIPHGRRVTELGLKVDLSGGKCTPGRRRMMLRKKEYEGDDDDDDDNGRGDGSKGGLYGGRGHGGKDGSHGGRGGDGKGDGMGHGGGHGGKDGSHGGRGGDGKGGGPGHGSGHGGKDGSHGGRGGDGKGGGPGHGGGHGGKDGSHGGRGGDGKGGGPGHGSGHGGKGGPHGGRGGYGMKNESEYDTREHGKHGMKMPSFGIGPEGRIWVKNGCSGIFVYGYKLAECNLPPSKGMCKAHIRKWFFNTKTSKCEQFAWGGCGGNGNRFHTEEECMKSCVNNEVTVSVHDDVTISGEIKFNGPKDTVLPPNSCATVQLKDKSVLDMPSIALASITFNVNGSNLTEGLAYQLEVNRPKGTDMHQVYVVSVAIKVGHCSDNEVSVEGSLKVGDYLTMKSHEITLKESESSYMKDVVVECVGRCNNTDVEQKNMNNRCKKGFYKDKNGKCIVIEKVLKTSLKMKKEFFDDLHNPNSEEFQNLAVFFEQQILELAKRKDNPYIRDVMVTAFKQGSIIVEYEIILDNTAPDYESSDVEEALIEAIEDGELDQLEPDMTYPIRVKVEKTGISTLNLTNIYKGKITKTLPIFPKTYMIELSVKPPTSYSHVKTNIVHFTAEGRSSGSHGYSTPAIFFYQGHLYFENSIGAYTNYKIAYFIKSNTWHNINIMKIEHYGIFYYSIFINGTLLKKVIDPTPRSFKNVKVYASSPWYEPFRGQVRHFKFTDLTIVSQRKKQAQEFSHVGCFRDNPKRAISGKKHIIRRSDIVRLCYEKAKHYGHKYFAVEYNHECFTSKNAGFTYDRYGKTTGCRNGRGGAWRMDVYMIRDMPDLKRNVATNWGQNVAGERGLQSELSLGDTCQTFKYDIISVQFVRNFSSDHNKEQFPSTNLSTHCSQKFGAYPELMNCPYVGRDIKMCQARGKIITLSLGGPDVHHSFKDADDARRFAKTIWNLFLGGKSDVRPFGNDVIMDGIDLNMKGGNTLYYADFVMAIRKLMDTDKKNKYTITATLKCILGDDAIDIGHAKHLLGDIPHELDHLYLKVFKKDKKRRKRKKKKGYGNKRNRRDADDDDDIRHLDEVLQNWLRFSRGIKNKHGKGPDIYVALMADPRQNGGKKYYISPKGIGKIMGEIGFEEEFGGAMIWDASYDINNKISGEYFSTHVSRIINSPHLYRALRFRKDIDNHMSHQAKNVIIAFLFFILIGTIAALLRIRYKRIQAAKVTPRVTTTNPANNNNNNTPNAENEISMGQVNGAEAPEEPPLPEKVMPLDDYRVPVPYSYNNMPPSYAQIVPNGYAYSAAPPSYANVMGHGPNPYAQGAVYPIYPDGQQPDIPPIPPRSPPLAPVEI